MIQKITIFIFLLMPCLAMAQFISVNTGFYNQKDYITTEAQNQIQDFEEDSYFTLNVEDIYTYKNIGIGASYSYMINHPRIFIKNDPFQNLQLGMLATFTHRLGFKTGYSFQFADRFEIIPYSILSMELNFKNKPNSSYEYANEFAPGQIEVTSQHNISHEPIQFIPTLGLQVNIRLIRGLNAVFNAQHSFGSKVTHSFIIFYNYEGEEFTAHTYNNNTGYMLGFGLGYDLDYKHINKIKK